MKKKDIKFIVPHRGELIVVTDSEVVVINSAEELKELTK